MIKPSWLFLGAALLPLGCGLVPVDPPTPPQDVEADLMRDGMSFSDMWSQAGRPTGAQDVVPDPGVIAAPDPGRVSAAGSPTHSVEPAESGRTTILELYQGVLDERDGLVRRVSALEADRAKLQEHLRNSEGEVATLELRTASLEVARDEAQAENVELGGRLLTAQIRRLEAEKLLLESKIQWLRAKRAVDESAVAAATDTGEEAP